MQGEDHSAQGLAGMLQELRQGRQGSATLRRPAAAQKKPAAPLKALKKPAGLSPALKKPAASSPAGTATLPAGKVVQGLLAQVRATEIKRSDYRNSFTSQAYCLGKRLARQHGSAVTRAPRTD